MRRRISVPILDMIANKVIQKYQQSTVKICGSKKAESSTET